MGNLQIVQYKIVLDKSLHISVMVVKDQVVGILLKFGLRELLVRVGLGVLDSV